MKKIILILLPIVLISLCSYFPNLQLPSLTGNTQVASIDSGCPDLFLSAETTSTDIKGGRSIEVFFEMRNKQNYNLSNVKIDIYDYPCFTLQNLTKNDCCNGGTLRSNQSCFCSWRMDADTSGVDRQCSIRFSTSYSAKNSIYQDIAVLPEAEYLQRQEAKTLSDIPIHSTSASGPLNIYLTFSEPQPFIANEPGYDMYINYNNIGNGFFGDMNGNSPPKITLNPSGTLDNIRNLDCGTDYDESLTLKRKLDFINGRAVPTNCNFATIPATTIDIRSLSIDVDYTYTLYNSISITVRGSNIPSTSGGSSDGGGIGCLLEGSKVLTPEGFKKIESLKAGDLVIGYENGKIIPTKITKTSSHDGEWTLYYYKGTWFTSNHKVYPSLNEEAVPVPLVATQAKEYKGYVYNIETETHNYFGENDLLIHNVMKE